MRKVAFCHLQPGDHYFYEHQVRVDGPRRELIWGRRPQIFGSWDARWEDTGIKDPADCIVRRGLPFWDASESKKRGHRASWNEAMLMVLVLDEEEVRQCAW